jgi:hypothetical protein
VAEEHGLGFAVGMRSEQSDEPSAKQFEEVDHPGNATALLRLCQPGRNFRQVHVKQFIASRTAQCNLFPSHPSEG